MKPCAKSSKMNHEELVVHRFCFFFFFKRQDICTGTNVKTTNYFYIVAVPFTLPELQFKKLYDWHHGNFPKELHQNETVISCFTTNSLPGCKCHSSASLSTPEGHKILSASSAFHFKGINFSITTKPHHINMLKTREPPAQCQHLLLQEKLSP